MFFCSAGLRYSGIEEINYCYARKELIVRPSLENFLETDFNESTQTPPIAFCFSGGGYRAMISSLGFMMGAEEIGLLKTATYVSALSGSTWLLGPYMVRKMARSCESYREYKNILKSRVVDVDFFENIFSSLDTMAEQLEAHYKKMRNVQLVDIYGSLIADRLLGDLDSIAQEIHFSDILPAQKDDIPEPLGKDPFPIFTAIHQINSPLGSGLCSKNIYEWFEFNPYKAKQTLTDDCLPTRSLGYYPDELSREGLVTPLLNLGYMLGLCGSAYACNAGDIIKLLQTSLLGIFSQDKGSFQRHGDYERGTFLNEIVNTLKSSRFCPAQIPNFTASDPDVLTLQDAGIDFNLPLPPLLTRNIPFIFVCDASGDAGTRSRRFPELHKAAAYANQHGLPFPSLQNPRVVNDHLLVFESTEPNTPTIFYFHNIVEMGTFEFNYSEEEFESLCEYMRMAVIDSADAIKAIMREKIA